MLCICCLKKDSPLIKITQYCHGDFLNQFFINGLPPFDHVVCWECHMTLKKINQFRKQVEESFKQLMKQSQNTEINKLKEKEAISSEEHHKPDDTHSKSNDTRLKNIDRALNIINSNTASLQSITLFESIITATKQNFNLQTKVLPELNKNNDNNKKETEDNVTSIYQSAVLSAMNRKLNLEHHVLPDENNIDDSEQVEITDVYGSAVLSDVKSDPDIEMLPNINNKFDRTILEQNDQEDCPNASSQSILLLPDTNQTRTQTHILPNISDKMDAQNEVIITKSYTIESDLNETDIKTMLPVNNIKLPEENKNISEVVNDCDMTVLLQMKNNSTADYEGSYNLESTSCREVISEKNINTENSNDISSNKDDTSKISKPLIAVTLNRKQLFAERKLKSLSMEFKTKKYKCNDCIISFQYRINLKDHFKRKHTEKPNSVVCKICKQVISISDRKQHKSRHYNRLECSVCKQRFILYHEGYAHYVENHSRNDDTLKSKYKCIIYS